MKEAILQPMTVAGHRIDRPIDRVRQYATTPILVRTLNEYDFANRGDCDRITVEEAGLRTRRIASRVSGREALWFAEHSTSPAARAAFRNVPADAALQDADPLIADELYDRANSLFHAFRTAAPRGIAGGKIHKVLHVKRPHLIPILDAKLRRLYAASARQWGRRIEPSGTRPSYWAAIRADLLDPTNTVALAGCRRLLCESDDPTSRRIAGLSDLRLLDIIAWQQ